MHLAAAEQTVPLRPCRDLLHIPCCAALVLLCLLVLVLLMLVCVLRVLRVVQPRQQLV